MAEPLSIAASIIALIQITNSAVGYLYSVRGASREREAMISEATNLLGLLNGLRFRVESSNPDNEWFHALRGLATENGALDQCKQALELLLEKLAPSHEKRKMKDALGWRFKQNEVDCILERLGGLSSLVNVALEEDHFTLSQAIQHGMLTIGEDTAAIRQSTATLVDDNKLLKGMATGIMADTAFITDQRSLAIADWLSVNDNSKQQADLMTRHQSDTGRWFLESDAFREWEQGKYRILLCPGGPGAGKTMMAALAIDHLQKTARNRDSPVVFLYCNYKRSDDQGAVQLVRDILRQLAVHQPPIPKPIQTLYEKYSKSYPPEEAVVDTLEAICSDFADTMLVIDALDECNADVRSELLSILHTVRMKAKIRLLVTSRHLPDVHAEVQPERTLEIRALEADVVSFVNSHLLELSSCVRKSPDLQAQVVNAIVASVDGMFLLARLHLDSLKDKRSTKAVKNALVQLPSGSSAYDMAYQEAMERITPNQKETWT
ncbi:hypothetical protein LTR37_002359 [Vermiconidia calcicola]|uniref:Uncharacterized protein n=1 Tax=Vermiconidia calcicola TaxID=1690605 RepID=A0ACC3NUB0_9PEZI|nr:hypothetical protein LTR37_002359 [Vermiconidia calcicola]